MKKRLFLVILALVCALCCVFGLVACDNGDNPTGGDNPGGGKEPGGKEEHTSHEFDESYWEFDKDTHWHPATCGHKVRGDEKSHELTFGDWGDCTVCDYFKEPPEEPHEHNYTGDGAKYHANVTHHWRVCADYDCPDRNNPAKTAHNFVGGVCSVCEVKQVAVVEGTAGLRYQLYESYYNDGYDMYARLVGSGTATGADITVASVYEGYPVRVVEDRALRDYALTTVRFPNSLYAVFNSLNSAVKNVYYAGSADEWSAVADSVLFSYDSYSDERPEGYNLYLNGVLATEITFSTENVGYFGFCNSITSVEFAESVRHIRSNAFEYCKNLETVEFNEGNDYVDSEAFQYSGVREVYLPDSLTGMGIYVFQDCQDLVSLRIPGSIVYANGVVSGCEALEHIDIGGITNVDNISIRWMDSLKSVAAAESNESYASYGNMLFNKDMTEIVVLPRAIETAALPDSFTQIEYEFGGCRNLTRLTLSDKTTKVNAQAFIDCAQLGDEIDGALYIGSVSNPKMVLVGIADKNITNFSVNDGTKFVMDYAFSGCEKLTHVVLSEDVRTITQNAFRTYNEWGTSNISSIQSVTVDGDDGWYTSQDGVLYKDGAELELVYVPYAVTGKVVVPEGVKSMNVYAFDSREHLEEVVLPYSLREVDGWSGTMFGYCHALKKLTVPLFIINDKMLNYLYNCEEICVMITDVNSVVKNGAFGSVYTKKVTIGANEDKDLVLSAIEAYAFRNNNHIEEINITNVNRINNNAFSNLESLTTVNIGYVGSFYGECFYNCPNMKSVSLDSGYNVNYASHDGIVYARNNDLGANPWYVCYVPPKIEGKVTIPDGVGKIWAGDFSNCAFITEVETGNAVTTVEANSFNGCAGLIKFSIGSNVTGASIDNIVNDIKDCAKLESISVMYNIELRNYASVDGILYKAQSILCVPKALRGEIALRDNVSAIPANAFENRYINVIHIPETVKSIGEDAFKGCNLLVEVYNAASDSVLLAAGDKGIPDDCVVYNAYDGEISRVIKENGLYFVQNETARRELVGYDPTEISRDLELPDFSSFIYSIRQRALYNVQIDSITLPFIGANHNSGYESMEEANRYNYYSAYFYYIFGTSAKDVPSTLKTVTIYNGIESAIGSGAFQGCHDIQTIVIGDKVTHIAQYAFYQMKGLQTVVMGKSVEEIGYDAFYYNTALKTVTVDEENTVFCSYGGVLLNKDKTNVILIPLLVEELTIPGTIEEFTYDLGAYSYIRKLTIEEGVRVVDTTFAHTTLDTISIPNTIEYISTGWFSSNYLEMHRENGIYYVGNETNPYLVLLEVVEYDESVFTVDDRVKIIYDQAFAYGMESIETIIVPEGVTQIGHNAFAGCANLKTVILPESAVEIGYYVFENCPKLEHITINADAFDGTRRYCLTLYWDESYDYVARLFRRHNNDFMGDEVYYTAYYYDDGAYYAYDVPQTLRTFTVLGENIAEGIFESMRIDALILGANITSIEDAFHPYTNPDASELTRAVYPIKEVYYCGSESDWSSVTLADSGNENLADAVYYWYSDAEQSGGNYWHYDSDGVTPAKW